MLFTKTGAESIAVINFQGVRSAQCNAQFDELPQLISEPIFNSSDAIDKAWVEEPPFRIPYTMHINTKEKEEKTQVVFVTLTVIFVIIIICCIIEVYRTNRAHKKRLERETDEGIIRSKEQATKLHESPVKPYNYQPVPSEDETAPNGTTVALNMPIIGILKNNGVAGTTILEEPEGGETERDEWEDQEINSINAQTETDLPPRRCSTPGPGPKSKRLTLIFFLITPPCFAISDGDVIHEREDTEENSDNEEQDQNGGEMGQLGGNESQRRNTTRKRSIDDREDEDLFEENPVRRQLAPISSISEVSLHNLVDVGPSKSTENMHV